MSLYHFNSGCRCLSVAKFILTFAIYNLFIYLEFYITFDTVQVISRQVVGNAEETRTYIWSRFCTDQRQATTRFHTRGHWPHGPLSLQWVVLAEEVILYWLPFLQSITKKNHAYYNSDFCVNFKKEQNV